MNKLKKKKENLMNRETGKKEGVKSFVITQVSADTKGNFSSSSCLPSFDIIDLPRQEEIKVLFMFSFSCSL
jgi:hypothetical protein